MGQRLYVGNLPFSASEEEIRDLFAQNGRTVNEVRLITDRDTGRPRGFAFIEMDEGSADAAIQALNGTDMGGRALRVIEANERRGGGRGGRGGGRGRY